MFPRQIVNGGMGSMLMAKVKETTGIVEREVVPNAREVLISLYTRALKEVKAVPEGEGYRNGVERFTSFRLKVCEEEEDWEVIEERIGCGRIEELIEQAQDELTLIPRMIDAIMDSVQPIASSASKGKKRKKFLWNLNSKWVAGLLEIMSEYVDANMRSAQGFKDSVYQGAAQKLKDKFGIEVTGVKCKNQIRQQQSLWAHIQELKRKSGVSWDEHKKIILMGQEEYTSHIQAFPKDVNFLNIPIVNYDVLEKVCGEGHATREWAKSENFPTPFRTPHINLDDVKTSGFVEVGVNATQPNEWDETNIKEEHTGTSKRVLSSASKGHIPRKKCKGASGDENLCDYIAMMAKSIAQVANAIQGTTRAAEETKMFTQLMAELSSIQGFSEKEVDIIYDNLSKNPTMVWSFLAKPVESKARWMRKELGK